MAPEVDFYLRPRASRTQGTVREDRKDKIGLCATYDDFKSVREGGTWNTPNWRRSFCVG